MTGLVLPVLLAVLAQSADRKPPQAPLSPEESQSRPEASAPSAPGARAFNRVFRLPAPAQNPQRDPVVVALPEQKPASRIVCGMVVIQADPKVDPGFVIRGPEDTSAFKIRRIAPPTCAD
jgi:hypothetical protein